MCQKVHQVQATRRYPRSQAWLSRSWGIVRNDWGLGCNTKERSKANGQSSVQHITKYALVSLLASSCFQIIWCGCFEGTFFSSVLQDDFSIATVSQHCLCQAALANPDTAASKEEATAKIHDKIDQSKPHDHHRVFLNDTVPYLFCRIASKSFSGTWHLKIQRSPRIVLRNYKTCFWNTKKISRGKRPWMNTWVKSKKPLHWGPEIIEALDG